MVCTDLWSLVTNFYGHVTLSSKTYLFSKALELKTKSVQYIEDNYYMPARGCEFYLQVVNLISHKWAQWTSEISSWTQEDKIHIHKRVCNINFVYYINTSETPNQLSFKGTIYYVTITMVISSRVKKHTGESSHGRAENNGWMLAGQDDWPN